jgi:amino acid adenylation domain-containing protein
MTNNSPGSDRNHIPDRDRQPHPADDCIHTLFTQQAERTPEATALLWSEGALTYGELNVRANRLAHYLQAHGVAVGDCVAVCLERSPEMIVALLGILKAGAAYAPLDPDYPSQRLSLMLEDTAAPILLTSELLGRQIPADGRRVVCLEVEAAAIAACAAHNPQIAIDREALAYVMYTSGSTGRPKGVLVPHRGVVRLVRDPDYVAISASDLFLQFAPITFDASTFEIWGSLLNGARLALFPPHVPGSRELGEFIRRQGVTILWLTASLFHLMVEEQVHNLHGVRQLLAGGDALAMPAVRRFLAEAPGCVLINGYGPTENTTFTVCCRLTSEHDLATTVPIGKAISGTYVYIVDADGEPVTPGEVGELLAGGDGLALGYLNLPELTAERFVPDPFCNDVNKNDAGRKVYRTGDLVRLLPDGRLEFVGRRDRQVKVRGYRIEPGEIEAALMLQPGVREAAVLAPEDGQGDRRLEAYLALQAGTELTASQLRQELRRSLPDALIPVSFTFLPTLPLTPHGKVDRAALTAMATAMPTTVGGPLRSPLETLLAEIWAEILHIPLPGADADFFELGGNSLRAMQVVSRLEAALGADCDLRALFKYPILRQLAAHLEESGVGQTQTATSAIHRASDEPVLSPSQQWLGHACWKDLRSAAYNIPYLWFLRGSLDAGALQAALQGIVTRHEPFRYQFRTEGVDLVTTIREPGALLLSLHDLAQVPNGERESMARAAAARLACLPFDLASGALLRATLWRLDPANHLLLINIHHLAFDGWSFAILADELSRGYNAALGNAELELPELPIRYRDYSRWRLERAASEVGAHQYGYWDRQLASMPELLNLPLDGARAAFAGDSGATLELAVNADLCRCIDALARQEAATRFMVLLAAWSVTLFRWCEQERFAVWTPVAGRNRETERLIGYFVNVLPLCVDLSGSPSFRSLVRAIRDATLDAFANQDVSAEHFRHAPRLQTLFVLQNASTPELTLKGIGAEVQRLTTDTSKFELSLELEEQGQGLRGGIEYRQELFREEAIQGLASDFLATLVSMAGAPEQAVRQPESDGSATDQRLALPPDAGTSSADAGPAPERRLAATGSESDPVPADDVERRLAACWARLLRAPSVSPNDDFFALGGHSLLAVRMLGEIERDFGRRLTLAALLKAPTVREMARLLRDGNGNGVGWASLVPLQTEGDLRPLFCAPVAGGSAFYYRTLAAELAPTQPLYTFEPRGMSGVLPPHETVEEMAAYYIEQMRQVQPQGPYALAGLSFGGIIAFEMARQLQAGRERVAPVTLFDAWAPATIDQMLAAHTASSRHFGSRLRFAIGFHRENLVACPTARARLLYIWERAHKLRRKLQHRLTRRDGNHDRINPVSLEMPELFTRVAQAEERARASYRPGRCAIQVRLLRAHLHMPGLSSDPTMGWQEVVTDVDVVVVPGTHYSLLERPCVSVTAAHLRRMLAEELEGGNAMRRPA